MLHFIWTQTGARTRHLEGVDIHCLSCDYVRQFQAIPFRPNRAGDQ